MQFLPLHKGKTQLSSNIYRINIKKSIGLHLLPLLQLDKKVLPSDMNILVIKGKKKAAQKHLATFGAK